MFVKRCFDAAFRAIVRRKSSSRTISHAKTAALSRPLAPRGSVAELLEERLVLTATVTLGTFPLTPNAANQTISIYVGGGDVVGGVDLEITTGDGTAATPAPVITAVNLFPAGGIFTANNTGVSGIGQLTGGHFFDTGTVTTSGVVSLGTFTTPQLLATVTLTTAAYSYTFNSSRPQEQSFSTAAISSGDFSISVGGTDNNGATIVTQATDFPPETSSQVTRNPNFTDGVLAVGAVVQNATINVTGASVAYDGKPHAAVASATGTMGENLNSLLHLSYTNLADNSVSTTPPAQIGAYEVFASFDGNSSYNAVPSFDTGKTLAITKGNAQLDIVGATAMVDGNPHPATGTAMGATGEDLSSLLHLTYKNLADNSVSANAPTQTGTYEVFASFDGNATYNAVASFDTNRTVNISPAGQLLSPALNISGVSMTFDGSPHAASATATGGSGENLTALLHISYENTADSSTSATPPSQVGTYEVFASFDGNAAYKAVAIFDTNQSITIAKANAVLTFASVSAPFDGAAHPAAGTATGVASEDLHSLLQFSYTNLADNSVSTSTPVQVGTYEVFASFAGNNNYNAVALFDTGRTITINASGPLLNATLTITGAAATFDGNPHPASAVATGASGEDLTSLLHISYENLADGTMSAAAPTQVGSYEVFASFDGNSTYNADPLFDAGATIYISKAVPAINVASAVVPANGNPQSAPVTITGPDGQDLSSLAHVMYENLATNVISTTPPTQVGNYEVFASIDGNGTYEAVPLVDTGKTLVITNFSPLKATASGKLPAATLVAGQKITPIHLSLKLTNTGAAAVSGSANVQVVLSTSPEGTTTDTVIATVSKHINLKVGKGMSLGAATIKSLPAGLTGTLYVLVKLTDATGATNLTSPGSITAANPFIDLAGASITAPAAAHLGKKLTSSLSVIQNGNIRFAGIVPVQLYLSTTNTLDSNAINLGAISAKASIQPHKKSTLHLSATIISAVTAGQYFVIADIDPTNTLGDTVQSNNVIASVKTVMIK